jgi:DNA topoisomerase-2
MVEMNKDYKMYNPHLIFGCLRSSTNYRQTGKLVGGKNGFGAKLTNIFSKKFTITVVDREKRKYYQEFSDNMKTVSTPVITTTTETPYLLLTFTPDYEKLNTQFSKEFMTLIEKRIYDITSCMKGVKVFYNNSHVNIASFEDYISCYYDKKYLKENMYFDRSN